MKKYLLAAALSVLAAPAYAAGCTVLGTTNGLNFVTGSSDNQCNDGDDLKMFLDGTTNSNSAGGSLGGNNNSPADSNITVTSTGSGFTASTDGNGFANFKSDADNVTAYELTGNAGTVLPKTGTPGTTFNGFDGSLMRGQITNNPNTPTVTWDGDVSIVVNLSNSTQSIFKFTGFKQNADIGVIGFDEVTDPGVFVTSFFAVAGDVDANGNLIAAGLGSWDEFKQIEMSVPGQVAAVPELSTWAMFGAGFALIGLMGLRKRSVSRFAV